MPTLWTANGSPYDTQAWLGTNRRSIIVPSDSAGLIRFQLRAHATVDASVGGASIGLRSGTSGDFSGAPTRITFDGGSSTATITANSTIWSDWIVFNMVASTSYLAHYYGAAVSSWARFARYLITGTTGYYKDGAGDTTMTESAGMSSTTNISSYAFVQIEGASGSLLLPRKRWSQHLLIR